jgi:hypothetical protein
MVFSPLVKRQVPFLHVPVWRFQIKNGLLSGDRFVGHWCQNATPLNLQPLVRLQGEIEPDQV